MATTKTNTKFKAPTTYGTAVVYLNKIFDLCNDKYFEGELTRPTITIQSTPKAYGHVTVAEVWENESNGKAVTHHELNIGADTLNRPINELTATIIHEMVHLYCIKHGIKDTSNKGVYHNKRFKVEAEKRGLIITQSEVKPSIGWSVTTPTEELTEWVNDLGLKDCKITRHNPTKIKKKSKSNSIKWTCPSCEAIVRSTKRFDVAPICGECFEMLGEIIHFEEN